MRSKKRNYYFEHLLRLEQYSARLTRIYKSYVDEFLEISKTVNIDPNKPFSFSDYPKTLRRVNTTFSSLIKDVKIFFDKSTRKEWIESNKKNDALVGAILKNSKLTKNQIEQFFNHNLTALERFQQRKIDGLNLSERIWKNTEQFKSQIEFAIDVSIGDGVSAVQLSKDVKKYLEEPDNLFRRVRDKRGNLVLSKNAQAFNRGRGYYRSSYKNAERLARTEINMAYREADINRYQSLPFVVGYEIKRSNNPFSCIQCESLTGKYPKWFKFNGWHPNCRCYVISILATKEELKEYHQKVLDGEDNLTLKSVNEVKDVPESFKKYVSSNLETLERRKSTPYWVRDNFNNGKLSDGLSYEKFRPVIPKKRIKTEAQKEYILKRWSERNELRKVSLLNRVSEAMENANVQYNEVSLLPSILKESEIISRVGGGDLTKGSCSSLAFAYAGNKIGLDVLDFRDGISRQMFSKSKIIIDIAEKVGGIVTKNTNDFTNANTLLKNISLDKEYYFTCGKHAAIVRKTNKGFEYLELQSATNNGFKTLTTDVLKKRFGAKRSHTFQRRKYEMSECLIDIDLLKKDSGFKKLLGYINTPSDKQEKGVKGKIK